MKPLTFGQPEKPNLFGKIVLWLLIVLGIAVIGAMIATNPPEPKLVCRNVAGQRNSLTTFGNCEERN